MSIYDNAHRLRATAALLPVLAAMSAAADLANVTTYRGPTCAQRRQIIRRAPSGPFNKTQESARRVRLLAIGAVSPGWVRS